jgi:hypothetical protein
MDESSSMFCDCATVFEHDLPTCEMLRMLSRHVIEINKISQDKPIFTSYSFQSLEPWDDDRVLGVLEEKRRMSSDFATARA